MRCGRAQWRSATLICGASVVCSLVEGFAPVAPFQIGRPQPPSTLRVSPNHASTAQQPSVALQGSATCSRLSHGERRRDFMHDGACYG